MKLTRVTITGADGKTERAALDALGREYPFVEWALLISPKRAGGPRYPSTEEIVRLLDGRPAFGSAFHLCGPAARKALGGTGYYEGLDGLRIQVNGFTKWVDEHGPLTAFGQWLSTVRAHGTEVILQVQHERALSVARLLADIHPNVSALWDGSGGRGLSSPTWPDPLPGLRLGYAGGIDPDNVAIIIEKLVAHPDPQDTWIDMESGVRTNDELDFDKVRRVLAQAAPYVQGQPVSS